MTVSFLKFVSAVSSVGTTLSAEKLFSWVQALSSAISKTAVTQRIHLESCRLEFLRSPASGPRLQGGALRLPF